MKCNNIKCSKEHDSSYGSGKYCSRKCANSRAWTKEDKKTHSIAAKNSIKVQTHNKQPRSDETMIVLRINGQKLKDKAKLKILSENWDTLSWERLRKRTIWEQKECCNKCGLSEWLKQPITLEIDHIDGDNKNNTRNNIEALCPNCHSLTPTWRGRNKSKRITKISDEDMLIVLIKNNWNMRLSLIEMQLAPKGGNYKRCHKLKNQFYEGSTPFTRTMPL